MPGSIWQRVLVLDADDQVVAGFTTYVPADGVSVRCDQHPTIDQAGKRELLTATALGRRVAAAIHKRPSVALVSEIRRDDWQAAMALHAAGNCPRAVDHGD